MNGQSNMSSFFPLRVVNQSVSETVAIIKSGNVKRHYETEHRYFEQTYPLKSEVRARKVN